MRPIGLSWRRRIIAQRLGTSRLLTRDRKICERKADFLSHFDDLREWPLGRRYSTKAARVCGKSFESCSRVLVSGGGDWSMDVRRLYPVLLWWCGCGWRFGEVELWMILNNRPGGFDPVAFQGPFLNFLAFAQYLVPLPELFGQKKPSKTKKAKPHKHACKGKNKCKGAGRLQDQRRGLRLQELLQGQGWLQGSAICESHLDAYLSFRIC